MSDLERRLAALPERQRGLLRRRLETLGLGHLVPGPVASTDECGSRPRRSDAVPGGGRSVDFSLFFFSADGSSSASDKYRLLLDAAEFADDHRFTAVWTPERHFQPFGGLYPNPSVVSAALAMRTRRLQIRAGSVVLPLHRVIRVAEEWSVVDNLSGGRVGVALASGWHRLDFVLARESYGRRRETLPEGVRTLRELWSGREVEVPGVHGQTVAVRLTPHPLQSELPLWLTTAGNPDTWRRAGELGANVLAALIGQSVDQVGSQIALYRRARAEAGHDPEVGKVTLMLHTYVGEDDGEVKHRVEGPLRSYLRSYLRQKESSAPVAGDGGGRLGERDLDDMVTFAFEHYFESSSLLGTPAKCRRLVDRLSAAGVDEVACLVDFGLEPDEVLTGLRRLDGVARSYYRESTA